MTPGEGHIRFLFAYKDSAPRGGDCQEGEAQRKRASMAGTSASCNEWEE